MDIDHCATLKCYAESDEVGSTPDDLSVGDVCHPDDLRSFHDSKAVLRVHTILQCPRLPKIKIAQFQRVMLVMSMTSRAYVTNARCC